MGSAEENQNKENKISLARENIQFPLGRQKKSYVDWIIPIHLLWNSS